MAAPPQSVVCADLSFGWPDGRPVLDHLDVAFGAGRTGLIGRNGGGKSTLLRLIAGELTATGGSIATAADVAYLPQHLPLQTGWTVADLLGIRDARTALNLCNEAPEAQRNAPALMVQRNWAYWFLGDMGDKLAELLDPFVGKS